MENEVRNITVECITPVHVGSGVKFKKDIDFFISSNPNILGIIDDRKVIEALGGEVVTRETVNAWVNAIDQNRSVLELLPSNITIKQVSKRVRNYTDISRRGDLREQMHTSKNQPMIPGSSLKGAIRTAIWDALIKDDTIEYNDIHYTINNRDIFSDKKLNKKAFSPLAENDKIDPNKDILRFFQITDVIFNHNDANNEVLKVLSDQQDGWKVKPYDENAECIITNAKTFGRIKMDFRSMANNLRERYVKELKETSSLNELWRTCNQYTLKMLKAEIAFFREDMNRYNDSLLQKYINKVESLINTVNHLPPDSCMIRLGHGTGYRFMTGNKIVSEKINDRDLQKINRAIRKDKKGRYDDYFYIKSRKMTSGGVPLGFVKLEFEK